MSFKAISENKMLAKISEFTVVSTVNSDIFASILFYFKLVFNNIESKQTMHECPFMAQYTDELETVFCGIFTLKILVSIANSVKIISPLNIIVLQ